MRALIDCAYQLNPHYNRGAIDQFLIRYEPGRPEVSGDFAERRKPHFDRAVKLSDRYRITIYYRIGLSGSAGGIEPADVLLSLPQSRSPLASYTASHICALCRRPADHFYP